ncbi:MAG: hypothetical protein JRH15_06025 [Deltaproteobacteria bacterium]|nr:hypothetical protein [Deltaproteobacteria bacterium]
MTTRVKTITPPDWAGKPIETELAGWPVITGFESDIKDATVFLANLSHRPKALAHGDDAKAIGDFGPNKLVKTETGFAGALIDVEAMVVDLFGPGEPNWPEGNYTDVTDAYALLALWGPESPAVMQRLVSVDVVRPDLDGPFFLGTSSHGIFVYIINLKGETPGYLLACTRSQAENLYQACIRAGRPLGIKPEGTEAFDLI